MSDGANGHPRDLLSEYLDDELSVEARSPIDRHLASCEDCRAELDALRHLASAVGAEDVPPVPLDLAARIGRSLDAATIVRPRRSRFVVPATIAATLGAIGILVALQWREGGLGAPATPETKRNSQVADELTPTSAPARLPSVARTEEAAPREKLAEQRPDALEKDADEPSGGVVGGVVGGISEGVAGAPPDRVSSVDGGRERADFAQPAPAGAAAGKSDAAPSCLDRWSDSGVHGSWDVPDVDAAERQLGRIAHAVSGIGLWRGVAEGRPYVVVVPRGRFEEVVSVLRARGVAGLDESPTLGEGGDCTGISIELTAVAK